MSDLKELKDAAKDFTILYVEDNDGLRLNAAKLLKKFFSHVDVAEDGQVGLELFKTNHYPIVITDIKMPKMDGMTLAKNIKNIKPETKTIIMSAFDDKELLLKGIEHGIFRFLKKPVSVQELSTVLHKALLEIEHEANTQMFYKHLHNIFNHQSSMIIMLEENKVILANDKFLDFFDCECIDKCAKTMDEISANFIAHNGFLSPQNSIDIMEILRENSEKLFHVKLKDKEGKLKHFIIKYQDIPEKVTHGVLSFDDVTELNLLKLFDNIQNESDEELVNTKAMFKLLSVIQRNSAKIKLHNYYKGLSITNNGVITEIKDNAIIIKTTYIQQKAIQLQQKLLIVSEALPNTIECLKIEKINFEQQEVTLSDLRFVHRSPIMRKTIRVVPGGKPTVSLFMGENKFHGDVEIEDLSLDAVKLKLNALPAGLEEDSEITLDIVLEMDKKPLIINTKASMLRKSESKQNFHVVFIFKDLKKSGLVKYITKRQMALIREIKRMKNG